MCLEDLKLGRGRIPGRTAQVLTFTNSALPANATRVAIIVSTVGAAGFNATGPVFVVDAFSITFGPTNANVPDMQFSGPSVPFVLRIEDVGQAITGPISVTLSNNSTFASVTLKEIYTEVDAAPAMRDYGK